MRYQIKGLSLELRDGEDQIKAATAKRLNLAPSAWTLFHVVRKSLDARRNRPPRFVYTVEIEMPDTMPVLLGTVDGVTVTAAPDPATPTI